MMWLLQINLLLLFLPTTHTWLELTRDISTYWNLPSIFKSCTEYGHAHSKGFTGCECDTHFDTIMTIHNEKYHCSNPTELKCIYSIGKLNEVYMISLTNETREIIKNPEIISIKGSYIKSVNIWNLIKSNDEKGTWNDITYEASAYFKIHVSKKVYISYMNLDLDLWQGHVLKFTLNSKKEHNMICFLVKFRGQRKYAFNVTILKQQLLKGWPKTTKRPTSSPYQSKVSPTPSTIKRETEGVHSTVLQSSFSLSISSTISSYIASKTSVPVQRTSSVAPTRPTTTSVPKIPSTTPTTTSSKPKTTFSRPETTSSRPKTTFTRPTFTRPRVPSTGPLTTSKVPKVTSKPFILFDGWIITCGWVIVGVGKIIVGLVVIALNIERNDDKVFVFSHDGESLNEECLSVDMQIAHSTTFTK